MKTNRNKGFSMIEIIVVVAIIGLFTALSTIGFGYLKAGNVKSAAQTLDSTLNKLKLDTMSKEQKPYMCIYKEGKDYYMLCSTDKNVTPGRDNGQRIGNANVKISVGNDTIDDKVYIAFKKGSGTFSESIDVEGKIATIHKGVSNPDVTILVEEADGKGTSYTIHLVRDTGKHYIKIN